MNSALIYLLSISTALNLTHNILVIQPGINEFYNISKEVNRYYFSFSDLTLIIGAICGLLGGLRIYNNWQSGKTQIDAQIIGWLLSCIFLSLLSTVLKIFFSLN